MIKIATFALMVLWYVSFGVCGDLVLRIDTVGYENVDQDVENQKGKLLRRIDVSVEPGKKFRAACKVGLEKMDVSGHAEAENDGRLKCFFYYRYGKIPAELADAIQDFDSGMWLEGSSIQSSLSLSPGEPTVVGGVSSSTSSVANPRARYGFSKTLIVVTLIEVD